MNVLLGVMWWNDCVMLQYKVPWIVMMKLRKSYTINMILWVLEPLVIWLYYGFIWSHRFVSFRTTTIPNRLMCTVRTIFIYTFVYIKCQDVSIHPRCNQIDPEVHVTYIVAIPGTDLLLRRSSRKSGSQTILPNILYILHIFVHVYLLQFVICN